VVDLGGWQAAAIRTTAKAAVRTGGVCRFLAHKVRTGDDRKTMKNERRRRRADTVTQALTYQLAACCEDGRIDAMVVADGDGLPLASSGDTYACDEVAARMVHVGRKIREFNGTLLENGQRWDIQMVKVRVDNSELLVCAVGGTADQRKRQIRRGAEGAVRILAA
jgi:hypothetical protein